MRRLASAVGPLALLGALGLLISFLVEDSQAELDNAVFTSPAHRLGMVVPRGWRATDQPSYPGLLLWMMRTQPRGQIVLTAETFSRRLYCSWPITCRATPDPLTAQFACALRSKLASQRFRVGPAQAGPKETAAAGLPTMWFDYDDGKRFLRQAVSIADDRAISLVLSAPSVDARAAHVRPFDQALRTLRQLTADEATPRGATTIDAGATAIVDAGVLDGGALSTPTALDAGLTFESAPAPKIEPVGPCPK